MHTHIEVLIDKKGDPEKLVSQALHPVIDHHGIDWWVIGGRWSGAHDDYDPTKDPQNIHKGEVKWPSEWTNHPGDIMAVEDVKKDLTALVLVVNGEWIDIEDHDWQGRSVLDILAEIDADVLGRLVTVDAHN